MVKNRISSQYVFGYQKFILYPEDYKTTKSGKKKCCCLNWLVRVTVLFGVGKVDIGYARAAVHPRNQKQLPFGTSPI